METAELELRVRYAETNQMGVAHHASFFVWFEAARTEFIRARGRSYADVEAAGWLLVVVEAQCRYRRPARYDDVLVIRTHLPVAAPVDALVWIRGRAARRRRTARGRLHDPRGGRSGRAGASDSG